MADNKTLELRSRATQSLDDGVLDLTKVRALDGAATRLAASESSPFWADQPGSWSTVFLGAFQLPGLCTVKGKVVRRKDKKKVAGVGGAVVTDVGHAAAEITVHLRMWTQEHWTAFAELAAMVRPRPNQPSPKAYDFAHPAVAIYGVKSVELVSISLPYMVSESTPDVYGVDLALIESLGGKGASKVNTNKSSVSLGNILTEKTNAALGPQASFSGPRKPSDTSGPNASYLPAQTSSQP